MTSKEIRLGQTKYFILQYLRTCPSVLSASSIAQHLELSRKSVSSHLKDMREMGIIEDDCNTVSRNIKIAEGWQ